MNKEKEQWYALYVRLHHEKKTAEKLAIMGEQYFLPVQEEVRQWSDRKKRILVCVIPMMVFVRCSDKRRIELMNLLPSVTGSLFDRTARKVAVIRDEEMEAFKFMCDYSKETVEFVSETLKPGEKVEVIKGPMKGLKGELVELEGKSLVVVHLDNLGYAKVEMPIGFVKKV